MLKLRIPSIEELKVIEAQNEAEEELVKKAKEFGISEKLLRYCYLEGEGNSKVIVHDDGEGDSFFTCELPLCSNRDLIEVGSIYSCSYDRDGYIKVIDMELLQQVHSVWNITWVDTDGSSIEDGYIDNFVSIFW